ncbi:hypothetical protein PL321_03685 [Caloramator sp. mosi_1]|uniref:hypothetical protein n=1 Tax=Caloramator sp. mosi_1 TaxID=3023090 RepID=UPI002362723A|nr:hypothetical protein [Caloramator sp. mosi_1]WDC84757.1 hypothetical protein PL321_03685 [Caloramator sp. mosi_1]
MVYKRIFSYLTESWVYANSYTVNKTVIATSMVSTNLTFEAIEELKLTVGYGQTKSTSYSIGLTIPADSKRQSKLAFDVLYKKQNIK